MESLYRLKDKLCKELEEIARKDDMSPGDLEAVHKLTDTIKNIDKIGMLEEGGNSYGDGNWEANGNYSNRTHSYNDGGNSYANRRGTHYVRGHYSRDNMRDNRYNRDGAKEYMIDQLEGMMQDADNSKVRDALQRCMNSLENA